VADQVASDVCSLPLHHNLADEDVDAVVAAIHEWR
jgi:dTDP-4-amino-4,6-dideoxygalactose transaminase